MKRNVICRFLLSLCSSLFVIPVIPSNPVLAGTWCTHGGAYSLVGDFNGDAVPDILCTDYTGGKWIKYGFNGAEWSIRNNWCTHTGARVYVGDFNKDGRSDLLCHDRTGGKWIAYANSSGNFGDFNIGWSTFSLWCTHPGSVLSINDYNHDGRDDLACTDNSPLTWVVYANPSGTLNF
ncbi:FG-GAP repeat domain-containing protein [Nostoc sphaeroides]|uniref:VCBS repeat-containing protein n=1 Tax=Nostoc sphaeroides CCNUC1 TaxID=2653204 RepID=A0A5P8W2M3_9NOSO|nr:VCBS repeat-containing protein [Nostoc sphaeroides]MCC5630901.1 VCBS repeat-containing protein [Nostoc sphaeroides CHAB 2801]QFS46975.1 hypothetical protein GXM_04456 [Nostoc sphaeroides CCNUC1]